MVRDKIATLEQYRHRIKRAEKRIDGSSKRIADGVVADVESVQRDVWNHRMMKIRVGYSAGFDLDELAEQARSIYSEVYVGDEGFAASRTVSGWTVALAILFSVDDDSLRRIVRYGIELGRKPLKRNRLFYRLLSTGIDVDSEIMALKESKLEPYLSDIIDAIETEGKDQASQALVEFVKKKWYLTNRGSSWWGTHKKPRTYDGYWAFDAAAVAVAYGLDDSPLEGHRYYPWELAEYARKNRS